MKLIQFIYIILTYILYPFAKIILLRRVSLGKEILTRYREKLGFPSKKKIKNIIWFHAASLGEIRSIIPIIEYYNKKNKNILVTTSTVSAYFFLKKKFNKKNIIHQFCPLDFLHVVKKFLNYWKPKISIFVDSEIWPNLINETSKVSKIIIINCRISKKSFSRWKIFNNFFKYLLLKYDLILTQNQETKKYLKFFGFNNCRFIGNLKLCYKKNEQKKKIKIKKNIFNWCAMSVHFAEVASIINIHEKLSKINKNISTFIIPRHLNKIKQIETMIKERKILYKKISKNNLISKFNGIILIDQFGIADQIFSKIKIIFMGGSFINHGGQNPIEPISHGCIVLHGKNIFNFLEIYNFLKIKKLSFMTKNEHELYLKLQKIIGKKIISNRKIIKKLGKEILDKTILTLNKYIN